MKLSDFIRDVPDFPKKGIIFKDITPLLKNAGAFAGMIDELANIYKGKKNRQDRRNRIQGFYYRSRACFKNGMPIRPRAEKRETAVPDD